MENSNYILSAGIINLINNIYFIADGNANYNFGKINFRSSFSHNYSIQESQDMFDKSLENRS